MVRPKMHRLILLISLLILVAGCSTTEEISRACFKDDCFRVEVASTPQERARGLMYRDHLDEDAGMLFIFEDVGLYSFWMKNTLIPLDMIWLDDDGTVVYIAEDVQPCGSGTCPLINPGKEARYVLEVNGGTSDKIGLKVGDNIDFV